MNRLCLGLCLSLVAGCAAEGARTLLILHNQVPDSDCAIPADDSGVFISHGTLDFQVPQEYTFSPVVRNAADVDVANSNRHVVIIQGADVELQDGPGTNFVETLPDDLRNRTRLVAASIEPSGGSSSMTYTLIDVEQAQALAGNATDSVGVQIVGRTRVFGTMDGNDIESPWFNYPVTICTGCVQHVDDMMVPVPGCFGDQYP